jgi:uncharacterized membrane protein (DUF485 family)
MADVRKFIKYLNIFLGIATMCVGAYIVVYYFMINFKTNIKLQNLPLLCLCFFFGLLGVMVLSAEFSIMWIRENCQFLNHKLGVFVFYLYLGSLMAYFTSAFQGNELINLVCLSMSIGYCVIAVLMLVMALIGEDKTNEQFSKLNQKITSDD